MPLWVSPCKTREEVEREDKEERNSIARYYLQIHTSTVKLGYTSTVVHFDGEVGVHTTLPN